VLYHGRERSEGEEVRVARVTAFFVGFISIGIAIVLGPNANVAFLVALAFAVAASANFPVIVLSLFWRRFNTAGAVAGLATGLASSLALIVVSPSIMKGGALFPLENPGIVSIPLGFVGAVLGTLLTREPSAEAQFTELSVRANTGLGAERAGSH
jgi:cation/acetate symporter